MWFLWWTNTANTPSNFTDFFVLASISSKKFWFTVSLWCLLPTHQVFVIFWNLEDSGGALSSCFLIFFFLAPKKSIFIQKTKFTSFWLKKSVKFDYLVTSNTFFPKNVTTIFMIRYFSRFHNIFTFIKVVIIKHYHFFFLLINLFINHRFV